MDSTLVEDCCVGKCALSQYSFFYRVISRNFLSFFNINFIALNQIGLNNCRNLVGWSRVARVTVGVESGVGWGWVAGVGGAGGEFGQFGPCTSWCLV